MDALLYVPAHDCSRERLCAKVHRLHYSDHLLQCCGATSPARKRLCLCRLFSVITPIRQLVQVQRESKCVCGARGSEEGTPRSSCGSENATGPSTGNSTEHSIGNTGPSTGNSTGVIMVFFQSRHQPRQVAARSRVLAEGDEGDEKGDEGDERDNCDAGATRASYYGSDCIAPALAGQNLNTVML